MATFKRKVFYVGGFDPRGVRFYYALYRQAVDRFVERTGKAVTVSNRRRVSPIRHDWTVANATDDARTDYSFLRWEDLVQRAWIRNPFALAVAAVRTYAGLLRHIDLPLRKALTTGPIITLFYPPLASILLPLVFGLLPFLIALIWLPWWAAMAIGLVLGIAVATPLLKRAHTPWLLRFFIFNLGPKSSEADPAMADRLDRFAREIQAALDEEYDEVLVVTHSNGSILAVPLITRLLAAHGGAMPANFALVTFGQCIPLAIARKTATRFRDQLRALGDGDFRWVDIGSPPDGAAFHNVDTVTLVGGKGRPRLDMLSPRFHLFYDPETYHKGWSNKYEIHFDYLRVADRVSPLDYPSITTAARGIDASIADFRAIP